MIAFFMLWMTSAIAADTEALFASSVAAARELDFPVAVAACEEVVDAQPDGPRAPSCVRRLERWRARASVDGSFTALQTLERVRRSHRERGPEAGRSELTALVEAGGLSPTMEVELAIWLARDALEIQGDAPLAESTARSGLAHRDRVSEALVVQLVSLRSRALAASGDLDEALAVEAEIRVGSTRESQVETAIRARWRIQMSWLAGAIFGGFVVLGSPIAALGWRRDQPIPWGLIPIVLGTIAGAGLAHLWSPGAGSATLAGGGLFTIVHLIALGIHGWMRQVPERAWMTPWVRIATVGATVAGLWLAVSATDSYRWMGW